MESGSGRADNNNLDGILITHELEGRPCRRADLLAEVQAMHDLARRLAGKPEAMLRTLASAALELCRAGSAGVSLLEGEGDGAFFRWTALAGAYAKYEGGTSAFGASPCGITLERRLPQLFSRPGRHFACSAGLEPPPVEALVIPLMAAGGVRLGAIWVVSHDESRRFDREDVRVLTALGDFTAAALRLSATSAENARLYREALREIEVRKRAEAERERFFAVGADLLVVVGFDGRFREVNPACEQTLGWTPDELIARPWVDLLHPDDREATLALDEQVRLGREVLSFENRYRHKDGSYRWLNWKARPYPEEGLIYAGATDITERRRADEALRESEVRWRTMAEALPNLLWTCRPDGRCDWLSGQWRDYTGIPADELLGLRWLETVVHPEDRDRTRDQWRAAYEDRAEYDVEFRIGRYDGEFRWFKTRGVPVRDERGEIVYWFGTCTEIEDVKRMEETLRDADRRKDEFLATLAHELRNPLSPIRTAVEILKTSESQEPEPAWARGVIERQVGQMARLLEDLLDVSRISRGKLRLRRRPVDLTAVVEEAVETSRPLIDAGGHELSVSLPHAPVYLDADPMRLAQVLANLLNNGAKYMDRGGRIELSAERDGDRALISVRDTGIGIAPEMLPRLFEMFAQATPALGRSQGGLGIGLALVKRLVEMHGGTIEARSDGLGQGSEFLVRLPVAKAPTTQSPRLADVESTRSVSYKIVVADDNHDAAESLARLLRITGSEVRTAYDGQQAVDQAEAYRPDVVLLDIGMPKLNGYEAARRIREQVWGEEMVLIALTGWGQEEDRRRAAEAGFDAHLVKPVAQVDLQTLLATATAGRAVGVLHPISGQSDGETDGHSHR